ncbi:MAG TPA: hypothetical protein VN457_02930, partial [Chlamydiales bacterium]|nr:hypothetical protein [Chlamydiales bacterium]
EKIIDAYIQQLNDDPKAVTHDLKSTIQYTNGQVKVGLLTLPELTTKTIEMWTEIAKELYPETMQQVPPAAPHQPKKVMHNM